MENNEKQKTNKTKMDGKKAKKKKELSTQQCHTRRKYSELYRFNAYSIDIIILKKK